MIDGYTFGQAFLLALDSPFVQALVATLGLMILCYAALADEFGGGGWFTRAIELGAICAIGVGIAVFQLLPDTLPRLGVTAVNTVLLLIGFVVCAGLGGAVRDLVEWVRGDWREPPPPFGS